MLVFEIQVVSLAVAWAGNSEGGPPGARALATETGGCVPNVAIAYVTANVGGVRPKPTSAAYDFDTYSRVYTSVNGQGFLNRPLASSCAPTFRANV